MQKILKPSAWLSVPDKGIGSQGRLRLSAAHNEWNHVGIALAAMEEGFFSAEGLNDVELIADPEAEGELLDREAAQVELLSQGVADIAIDPRTTFVLQARDQARPVSIVAARRRTHVFLLIGQKGLKTIEDIRGQTLEMGNRGGATDVMMRQVLKDNGMEPDKDVRFTYSGGPMHDPAGSSRAFVTGELGPAKLSSEREAEEFVRQGYPVLVDLRKLYPSRHDRVTAANEVFARNHPDQLKGFLKGMIRACRFVLEMKNKARFKQIMVEAGFLTEEREKQSFDKLFDGWQARVSMDLSLPREGIELIVDEEKRSGRVSPSFRVEEVLKLEALREAQDDLARA
jgi:ABC-type nitrate/sulfonate/bicarbonate transport system substrate-binding protein